MTEQEIANELKSIIAYCDVTKEKAEGLIKKLNKTPKQKKGLSPEAIAKVLGARRKYLTSNS